MSTNSNAAGLPPSLQEGLGDHRLVCLEWLESGEDLQLTFEPPRGCPQAPSSLLRIRFVWVTCLRLNLEFGDYGDRPLVFESTISPSAGGLSASIDFAGAPKGSISFSCSSLCIHEG